MAVGGAVNVERDQAANITLREHDMLEDELVPGGGCLHIDSLHVVYGAR